MHGRLHLNENKQCKVCEASYDSKVTTKIHPRKYLVMMETPTVDFYQRFYISKIHKPALNFTIVHIIGIHHCGNAHR